MPEHHDIGIDHLTDIELIGHGGFSWVYAATDTQLRRRVAVKVLDEIKTENDRRRFDRECEILGKLSSHPHIVTVFSAGYSSDNRPYLIMELVSGGSIDQLLASRGRIDWIETVDLAVPAARALQAAHDHGVLHRDIKPENILLEGREPRLADFGIAQLRDSAGATSTKITASWLHAPPETFQNQRDERSDLYSLASTMYTMIDGSAPFWRPDEDSLNPLVLRLVSEDAAPLDASLAPPALVGLLAAGLAKDPAARPRSLAEFAARLEAIRADHGQGDAPVAGATQVAPPTVPDAAPTVPPGTGPVPTPAWDPPTPTPSPSEVGAVPPAAFVPPATGPTPDGGQLAPAPAAFAATPVDPGSLTTPAGGVAGVASGRPLQPAGHGGPPPSPDAGFQPGGGADGQGRSNRTMFAIGVGAVIGLAALIGLAVLALGGGDETAADGPDGSTAAVEPLAGDPNSTVASSDEAAAAPSTSQATAPTTTTAAPTTTTTAPPDQATLLTGTWQGTYTCTQGLTGLTLSIDAKPDGTVRALYDFYPIEENPNVPSGSFTMNGVHSPGRIELTPDRWIDQPTGYVTAGLTSRVGDRGDEVLSGVIVAEGTNCTTFFVTKTDSALVDIPN